MGFEDSFRSHAKALAEELEAATAEKAALAREAARLVLVAPVAGTVTDRAPLVQPGQWINPKEPILGLRAGAQVEAYVAEADLPRIEIGAEARFIPDGGGASRSATVAAIDRVAVKALTEPALAAPYGGTIAARFSDKALVPDSALYRVRLTVPGAAVAPLRGQAHIDGEPRSLLGHALRSVAAVLIREWGM